MPEETEPEETEKDPFESMEAELATNLSEAPEKTEPEEEDTRWRLQTHTGLLLFFPEVTLACQWADDQTDQELQIGYGRVPLCSYSAFQEALKTTSDPVQALARLAPGAGDGADSPYVGEPMTADAIVQEASAPVVPITAAYPAPPTVPVDPGEAVARPATMTSEFQFRTGSAAPVWKARMLFFFLGMLGGGGVVYYVAWMGDLPGILY